MPQDFRDLSQTCTAHGQIAGRRMAQVVKPEVVDGCSPERSLPGRADIGRRQAVRPRKYQGRIKPSQLGALSQNAIQLASNRNTAPVGVFRIMECNQVAG